MGTVDVREIRELGDLEGLRDDWARLWTRDPTATPFQHPGWLLPWWRHLGEGDLRTLEVRREGRLVGLAPMYRLARGGARRWLPLGAGTGDYLGGVFDPGEAGVAIGALLDWIARHLPPEERVEWFQLRAHSPVASLRRHPGLRIRLGTSEPCHELTLPGDEAALDRRLDPGFRARLRSAWRRATAIAPLTTREAGSATLAGAFQELRTLHAASWEARGSPGVLADPRVVAAHEEALRSLPEGTAVLRSLVQEDRTLAIVYGLADPPRPFRKFYYYLGGFDPSMGRLSPGSLAIESAIRWCVRSGFRAFDFLRGGEAYKRRWGAVEVPTVAIELACTKVP